MSNIMTMARVSPLSSELVYEIQTGLSRVDSLLIIAENTGPSTRATLGSGLHPYRIVIGSYESKAYISGTESVPFKLSEIYFHEMSHISDYIYKPELHKYINTDDGSIWANVLEKNAVGRTNRFRVERSGREAKLRSRY